MPPSATFRDATIGLLRNIFRAVVLLVAAGAAAQLVETIEVRITNVDVVVTDRAGKPVRGLTKDDFEIYENGKLQPVTNFYEISEPDTEAAAATATTTAAPAEDEAPPAELRRRRIAVFVDQETVDAFRRRAAFEAVGRALDHLLREGDEAMIVTYFQTRRVLTDFTPDHEQIQRALKEAAAQPGGRTTRAAQREYVIRNAADMLTMSRQNSRLMPLEQAYQNSYGAASTYADQLYESQRRLIASIQETVSGMAGLEGRKVMIFIGGDLQSRPAVDVFDAVDAMYRPLGVSVVDASQTGEAAKRSLQKELTDIGREANTNGVTLYLIDAAASAMSRNSSETRTIQTTVGIESGPEVESAQSMHALASVTGGSALTGSSNFDLALTNVGRDLSSFYSLGYKPSGDLGERKIVVKVKKPGLNVRSRRSYTLETADEQINDRVRANVFHPRMSSEFAVTLEIGKAQAEGNLFRVPITVKFPGDITTIPDGTGSLAGEFAIYFATASVNGGVSPVAKDVKPFKFPESQAKAIQSQPIRYTTMLRVRAGEQIMSVAVIDRLGGRSGFARSTFVAP